MATKVAPPKNTGGGGFVFEEDVCAWLLVSMLVGEPVFGPNWGAPVRLDFQTRPEWLLDDVLVTTALGPTHYRFALSVKSNAQFTAKSAPSDFVAAVWEQWLHLGSTTFDVKHDFMGLVTAPLSAAAASSVSGLAEKARVNDPNLFVTRLATPDWATDEERSLFSSFACPVSLGQATTDLDTARLLQRLRFLQRDFCSGASESFNAALELCRRAVRSHTAGDARALWSILREVASELRPRAGSLTLSGLIERLRARVLLADYPDHVGDWEKLDARSEREVVLVRDSIADRIHLPREAQLLGITDLLKAHNQVALLGPSGVGKSALAKAAFEHRRANGERSLWIDAAALDAAGDFGAFETTLQLQHPLAELLRLENGRNPLVIIDGLDRLYSQNAFRNVASLLRIVSGEPASTSWRALAVSQSQEWPRVLEALQRAGAPVTRWSLFEAKAPQPAELHPVRQARPALGRLFLQPRIGTLLTNLKLLDLVVRRLDGGTEIDASTWVGESSVSEWFWEAEIDRGQERLARGRFARGLAQVQADQLVSAVSVDRLEASSLSAAQSLMADQLLAQLPGDRLAFSHDLYGDWARLRILLNHRSDLGAFLQERYESPLWHRAIRLLGIHLLEHADGITEWRELMSSFDGGEMSIVRDLLLEAPAFATNAGTLLEDVFSDLVAGEGDLLRRLLTRFLAFATIPNERMLEVTRLLGVDDNEARAKYRRPHWPYWPDVLAVLHAHRDDALRVAAAEVARLVEMWLEFVSPGSFRRREVAELAVMLGRRALNTRDTYTGPKSKDRERFYKCALLAAPERSDEVADLARVAVEREPRQSCGLEEGPPERDPSGVFSTGVMARWPDGPLADVDAEFQSVVLDSPCIHELYRVRPSIAREVILAALIEAPRAKGWNGLGFHGGELEIVRRHDWRPALYTQGPFFGCLRENFEEGLELITRLVDFATERANAYASYELRERRARAIADGHSEAEVDQALSVAPDRRVLVRTGRSDSEVLTFEGDASVYCWSSGLGNPPEAIEVALIALEQYFYSCLDAGEDVSQQLTAVLDRSRSVAPLAVLCDVGKRHPALFDGPLRGLLSAPELYLWEISRIVQGRRFMVGGVTQGRYFSELAREFYSLEHRRRDLRHIAMERLLESEDMQSFLAAVRDWWSQRRKAGEDLTEMVDQLHLWLDPKSYETPQDPTHGTVVVNAALERVRAERANEHQEMQHQMLVSSFPIRCRMILDERRFQSEDQLEELWQIWLRIRENWRAATTTPDGAEQSGDEYIDAITGGITVFVWHETWLSDHEDRRRVIEAVIEAIVESAPENVGFASERDVSTWTWDCFLAETGAMLWARSRNDERWRRLVAEAVFAEKYAAVRLLFSRCAEYRATLGGDFERLRQLAVECAHVRDRVNVLRSWRFRVPQGNEQALERLDVDLAACGEEAIASFVQGTLEPIGADWNHFRAAGRFREIDELRRSWADPKFVDFRVLRSSHEWLPLPDEALSSAERASVIQFWRVALDVVAARPRAEQSKQRHLYPDEDEGWVLKSVAAMVLQLRRNENPEVFCGAILDLRIEAHDWPEMFLNALHRCALASEDTPATYGPLVRQIVQHTFSQEDETRRWPGREKVWDALLGIDWAVEDTWAERHADYVATIWDVISAWMKNVPCDDRRLAKFARWLSKPAAAAVRLRTLGWLLESLRADKASSVHREEDADDAVAQLLNRVWEEDESRLRSTPEQFTAFRGLLAWLVERQNSLGLELQGRIGGLV